MSQSKVFVYNYSASENAEIQEIRKKYLPQTESKLEELKRLDNTVQSAGIAEALCVGIIGALVFGLGMCLAMQVIGNGVLMIVLGVLFGILGAGVMLSAYPLYRKKYIKKKNEFAPRILELISELSSEK